MNMAEVEHSDKNRDPAVTNSWLRVLLTGIGFYAVALLAIIATGNPILFPTLVMIGSFLVPVTYVSFFYERRHLSTITLTTVAMSFVYGGLLGVLAASVLEPIFIAKIDVATAYAVGLIEEFAKILGVLYIARRLRHDSEMDGLIIGAAAGMSFAALESSGYAFTAFLSSSGNLSTAVGVTLVRGILSPLGHGTWTAILASVLFRESRAGQFRIDLKVIGAYLAVSFLHGSWDAVPQLFSGVVAAGVDVAIGQLIVGAVGLYLLWRRYREATRIQLEAIKVRADDSPADDSQADQRGD
jgi:RsiW-degrading membrane proteinase PrsW (M82 family)